MPKALIVNDRRWRLITSLQGSGCGSWERKPRRNLPAQLPFSNYRERCSGHFSKKSLKQRDVCRAAQQDGPPRKSAAVYRSNAGQRICLNARPLMLHPLRINSSQAENKGIKAVKAIQSMKREKLRGHIAKIFQMQNLLHLTAQNWAHYPFHCP